MSSFFDSISSNKLARKLKDIGVEDKMLFQLMGILTNREVMVRSNETKSNIGVAKNGLVQGGSSSVILSTLYTKDVVRVIEEYQAKLHI